MQTKDLLTIIDEYINYMDRKQITKDSYKRILMQYWDYIMTLAISNPSRNDILKYKEYLFKEHRLSISSKTHCCFKRFLSLL